MDIGDTTTLLCADLDRAIREHGRYTLYDKGIEEIMDLRRWRSALGVQSAATVLDVLGGVLDRHDDGSELVVALVDGQQDRADFDVLLAAMQERPIFDEVLDELF